MSRIQVKSSVQAAKVGQARLPREFSVEVTDDERGRPDIRVEFEVQEGVPSCRAVHLTAVGAREVRAGDLASLSLLDLLDLAVRHLVLGDVDEVAPGQYRVSPSTNQVQRSNGVREVARARRKRGSLDLSLVAEIYRANVNDAPTQAVADRFEVSHRSAVNYVRRARDAGLLGPALRGKAGEGE